MHDLLWPAFDSPQDLAAVEQLPLSRRGVPPSSFAALERAAEYWPDRPAISVLQDAERWETPHTRTFAQLASDVRRAAHALFDAGARRGEATALLSPNCDELITAILGAQAIGVAAPISPGLSVAHATELVGLAAARVVIAAGPELDAAAWQSAREIAAAVGAHTLLALRPTGASGVGPTLEPLDGVELDYFRDRLAASASEELRRLAAERAAREALAGHQRVAARLDDGQITVVVGDVSEADVRAALRPLNLAWELEAESGQ